MSWFKKKPIKLCVDCKFFVPWDRARLCPLSSNSPGLARCSALAEWVSVTIGKEEYVYGVQKVARLTYPFCTESRKSRGKCGPKAKYFVPKKLNQSEAE